MKPLKKALSWLKKALGLGFGFIQNHDFIAVQATNHLKSLVRSPLVKAGVSLTPTLIDDNALFFLEHKALPVLEEVCFIMGIIRENEKGSLAVEEIIQRLQNLFPNAEAKVYIEYAGRLNYRAADGAFTLSESIAQAQDTFNTFFKGK